MLGGWWEEARVRVIGQAESGHQFACVGVKGGRLQLVRSCAVHTANGLLGLQGPNHIYLHERMRHVNVRLL